MRRLIAGLIPVLLMWATLAPPVFAQENPAEHLGTDASSLSPIKSLVRYNDGSETETAQVLLIGNEVWISVRDLSALFKATRAWRADLQKMLLKIGDHEIAVVVGSEVAFMDHETPVHLPGPIQYRDGQVYLPLSLFLNQEGKPLDWLPQKLRWDPERRELLAGREEPGQLNAIKIQTGREERLDLILDLPLEYRIVSSVQNRFVIRLLGASSDPDSLSVPDGSEGFLALAVDLVGGGVEVSFAVPEQVLGYQVVRLEHPDRISVVLSTDERAIREGRSTPFLRAMWGAEVALRTVVIDPGHGGGDAGARTPGGLSEAQVTLSLARQVALKLEERLGVTAILTRDTDTDLSNTGRTETANMASADLFLSLHLDGYQSPRVKGPRAVVARPELGPPNQAGNSLRELGFQVWGDAQRSHLNKAYALADCLVGEISMALGLPPRGVEEWPLPLLNAATMPAVFLEIDSAASEGADQRLADGGVQGRISDAIVAAIDRYRREAP